MGPPSFQPSLSSDSTALISGTTLRPPRQSGRASQTAFTTKHPASKGIGIPDWRNPNGSCCTANGRAGNSQRNPVRRRHESRHEPPASRLQSVLRRHPSKCTPRPYQLSVSNRDLCRILSDASSSRWSVSVSVSKGPNRSALKPRSGYGGLSLHGLICSTRTEEVPAVAVVPPQAKRRATANPTPWAPLGPWRMNFTLPVRPLQCDLVPWISAIHVRIVHNTSLSTRRA